MEIKIRYTWKRKSDDHIWQEITPIQCLEGKGDQPFVFIADLKVWELVARDLWTGLSDKNGAEIYEGDIVGGRYKPSGPSSNFYTLGTVEFEAPRFGIRFFGWWFDAERTRPYEDTMWNISDLLHDWPVYFRQGEVIGNIHENLELVEDK